MKTPLARKRGEKKRGRGAIFGGGGTIFRGENVIGEEVSEDYAGDEVKHMEDEYVVQCWVGGCGSVVIVRPLLAAAECIEHPTPRMKRPWRC